MIDWHEIKAPDVEDTKQNMKELIGDSKGPISDFAREFFDISEEEGE